MEKNKLIINGVFYLIVSIIFLVIFIKEKQIEKYIKIKRDIFSDNLVEKWGLSGTFTGGLLKKVIAIIESLGTAIILVLIIQKIYIGNFLVPTGSMIPTIMERDRLFANMVVYKFSKPKREDIIVFKEPIRNKDLYTKRAMGLPGEKIYIKDNHLYIDDNKIETREYLNIGKIAENDYWIIPKKGDKIEIVPAGNYRYYAEKQNIDVDKLQKVLMSEPGVVSEILPELNFYVNGEKTGMILDLIHNKENLDKIMNGEVVSVVADEDYYFALGDNTEVSFDSRFWGFVKESRIKGKPFVRFWPLNRIGFVK